MRGRRLRLLRRQHVDRRGAWSMRVWLGCANEAPGDTVLGGAGRRAASFTGGPHHRSALFVAAAGRSCRRLCNDAAAVHAGRQCVRLQGRRRRWRPLTKCACGRSAYLRAAAASVWRGLILQRTARRRASRPSSRRMRGQAQAVLLLASKGQGTHGPVGPRCTGAARLRRRFAAHGRACGCCGGACVARCMSSRRGLCNPLQARCHCALHRAGVSSPLASSYLAQSGHMRPQRLA